MRLPEHSRGTMATVLFHGLLLMLLLQAGFRTELPLPGEQGIAIDFGTEAAGEAAVNPAQPPEAEAAASTAHQEDESQLLTQDYEDAPALAEETASKPAPQKTEQKPVKQAADQPQSSTEKAPEKREVNQRALFTGKTVNNTPAGQNTTGAAARAGSAEGTEGAAAGRGGAGNSFDLAGRSLSSPLPRPAYIGQNEGIVVISITVDKDGNVIQAKFSLAGSTTSDEQLVAAALKAAEATHFNRQPDAPVQAGRITYTFKLQD